MYRLTAFVLWLQSAGDRGPHRVNAVLAAVREFCVLCLARGLRRGEVVSLRRRDVHFVPAASALGCRMSAYDLMCRGGYGLTCRGRLGDHARSVGSPPRVVSRSLSR
jgi:hypothetical protein